MYKHILLPVEFGVDYARAHNVAKGLTEEGGKITVLHAIEPVPTYVESYMPPDFTILSRDKVQAQLTELASSLGEKNTALTFGSAGRSIINWAEENGADCIVIASHQPALSDLVLGSTAAWVVRHAPISVHVLR